VRKLPAVGKRGMKTKTMGAIKEVRFLTNFIKTIPETKAKNSRLLKTNIEE